MTMAEGAQRARVLLVDGHSMIFADPGLAALQRRGAELARTELERRLTAHQDISGVRVVVVFDGKGERTAAPPGTPGGIQVFYSAAGETADAVIERLVRRYAAEFEILVATRDRAEQDAVVAAGAQWIGSDGLRALLEQSGRDLARHMGKISGGRGGRGVT